MSITPTKNLLIETGTNLLRRMRWCPSRATIVLRFVFVTGGEGKWHGVPTSTRRYVPTTEHLGVSRVSSHRVSFVVV